MDGDDQSNETSGGFIDTIIDLASSRPDSVSEDERDELMENAIDRLSEDADNRQALADYGGAYNEKSRLFFGNPDDRRPQNLFLYFPFKRKGLFHVCH